MTCIASRENLLLPVAEELVQVGQAGEIGHAVKEHFAGKMIALMLNDAGEKSMRIELDLFTLAIVGFHFK